MLYIIFFPVTDHSSVYLGWIYMNLILIYFKHGTSGILLLKVATVKIWNYLYNKEYGQLKGATKLN
jgi:predicted permease